MTFTNPIFIFLFLPVVLFFYYCGWDRLRPAVLLLASIFFYACGSRKYVALLVFMMIWTICAGRLIEKLQNKYKRCSTFALAVGIIGNLLVLIYYKYVDFIGENIGHISGKEYVYKNMILPLGLSFFVFKAISYLVDVSRKKLGGGQNRCMTVALYLSMFSQIQSGPISRFSDMGCDANWMKFSSGIQRFVLGFCKKILIANVLGDIVDEVYASDLTMLSPAYVWLGAICFSLQLFYDFAGYSDMAIGITRMFGYECPENFCYPYMTTSISEFWRRWHITLGSWFRDYIYIPLGGSRVNKKWKLYRNLFVVWLLTGLWHGASWNFVLWGVAYFIFIALEKAADLPGRLQNKFLRGIYQAGCLAVINFLWVLFRSADFQQAHIFLRQMLFLDHGNSLINLRAWFLFKDNAVFILCAILFCMPIVPLLENKCMQVSKRGSNIYQVCYALVLAVLFMIAISYVIAGSNNPFTYANF